MVVAVRKSGRQIQSLNRQIKAREEDLARLQNRIRRIHVKKTINSNPEYRKMMAEAKALRKALHTVNVGLVKKQQSITCKERDIVNLKAKISELNTAKEKTKGELDALQSRIDQFIKKVEEDSQQV